MFRGKKAKEEAKEAFLRKCNEEYETLMDDPFENSTSVDEFERSHLQMKSQLLQDILTKWKNQNGSSKMPSSMPTALGEKLDGAFSALKKAYLKRNHEEARPKDSIPTTSHNLSKFYKEEMDKYMMNEPNARLEELTQYHKKLIQDAIVISKTSSGSFSPKQERDLTLALNELYEEYRIQAEMNEAAEKNPAIGIDLGTTMCCVMVYRSGKVEVVENRPHGNCRTTPSYVTYHEDGSDTYGIVAKEDAYLYPEDTIYDAKRMIGRDWHDPNLEADRLKWPFKVVNENNNPKIVTWNRKRFPHEVSARLLTMFRTMAEEHLNLPPGSVRKAVITVPAYFTEPQRRATNEAAECAGLEVLNILSEPTAAAIAYTWDPRGGAGRGSKKALIYDLGGGTFDVAIAKVTTDNVEILVVDGDTHLGGQDFDQKLMDYCIEEFQTTEDIDIVENTQSDWKQVRDSTRIAMSRLKLQCEKTKERLSTSQKQNVNLERFHGDKNMIITVTRDKLEELIEPLVEKTLDIVERALENAKGKGVLSKEDIDDVILVGGSTRVPLVEKMLSNYFGGKQLCKHINPDEAVAYGAAIQAAILNNEKGMRRISVEDVTPFTLGIRVQGGVFSPIITKNSKIPISHTKKFVTTEDYQTRIRVKIYQGESDMCDDNEWLGEFTLKGFPARPKEMEMIDITMTIDKKGMLQVEAESCTSKMFNSITIKAERLGMDEDTIEKVREECEEIALAQP